MKTDAHVELVASPWRLLSECIGVCLCFLLLFSGCSKPSVESFSGATMGTGYNVRFVTTAGRAEIADLRRSVDKRLEAINELMSTYDTESELSQFNMLTNDEWFAVSPQTKSVVDFALQVSRESEGAFDPTVGPLVNLWGFGPSGRRRSAPTDDEIAAAAGEVGFGLVETSVEHASLRKLKSGVYVDLSAVAKGYAADAVKELLVRSGLTDFMVEIGGEVATRGTKPDGSPWRIGVEKPDSAGRFIQAVVELSGDAVATSGDYRNFFEHDGVRYSHTIDPTTGRPVTHDLATVTVRADSCMKADAYATAILVMGPERGYDWAEERGVAALLIRRTDAGPVELKTPAWESAATSSE